MTLFSLSFLSAALCELLIATRRTAASQSASQRYVSVEQFGRLNRDFCRKLNTQWKIGRIILREARIVMGLPSLYSRTAVSDLTALSQASNGYFPVWAPPSIMKAWNCLKNLLDSHVARAIARYAEPVSALLDREVGKYRVSPEQF